MWDEWAPVVRVGEPKFEVGLGTRIKVEVDTKGRLHPDWLGYFQSQVTLQQLDARYTSHDWGELPHISGSCFDNEAEKYIEIIDAAINYANTKFQTDVLPNLIAQEAQKNQDAGAAKDRQATLDDLAKKLAKPPSGSDAGDVHELTDEGGDSHGQSAADDDPLRGSSQDTHLAPPLPHPARLIGEPSEQRD